MKLPIEGAIDCDVHPAPPSVRALLPYLDEFWRDQITNRHIERMPFTLTSYPPGSAFAARPDWRPDSGPPAGDLDRIRRELLDPFALRYAVCNVLHGAIALFNEDMSAALCSAVNDWVARELLDREPRLRAAILVPPQNAELAVKEIERLAPDRRFVQVLLLAMGEMPLGRRLNWPIYAAAEKHELAVAVHAGSTYRVAPTYAGWPSHRVEDYVVQSTAFETQLLSLVAEGVFQKFPGLKVVMSEAGFTWLPNWFWRTGKTWRGVRAEVPWVDRAPAEIVADHVRFTLQPVDAPAKDPAVLQRTLTHIGSDRLILFSTDYPHWHFDGEDALPEGLAEDTIRKMLVDNPLETYPRLSDPVPKKRGSAARRGKTKTTGKRGTTRKEVP
jgi:predicted TIM-barrel fold metal-dependent hydrolase